MRVIVLCKAPVAGRVKTRLMTHYSAEEAADIHKQMTLAVMNKVCAVFDDVWLAVDDLEHEFFKSLKTTFEFKLCAQGSGDLGDRLGGLLRSSFAQDNEPVLFLGTDSPHIDIQRYKNAEAGLNSSDVVIGPVEDGGYDLIAVSSFQADLFRGIDWGSGTVFDKTMYIINSLGLSVKVLKTSFDLDRPQDLERAPSEFW